MLKIVDLYSKGNNNDLVKQELIAMCISGKVNTKKTSENYMPFPSANEPNSKHKGILHKSSPFDEILLEKKRKQVEPLVKLNNPFNASNLNPSESNLIFRSLKQCELGNTPEILKRQSNFNNFQGDES